LGLMDIIEELALNETMTLALIVIGVAVLITIILLMSYFNILVTIASFSYPNARLRAMGNPYIRRQKLLELMEMSSPNEVAQEISKEGYKLPVFYVGQAENLYERLRDHLSDGEPNACIVRCLRRYTCYFRLAKVARQAADRDCAERALYDHYNPRCNESAPPGEPCDINFE